VNLDVLRAKPLDAAGQPYLPFWSIPTMFIRSGLAMRTPTVTVGWAVANFRAISGSGE
jgi:hypothetical protein